MDHDGMMRSLADRILAADIATVPVAMLPGTMPLDEAWAQCRSEALDFNVVLAAVASGQSHVARREPSWEGSDLPLSTVSYPLSRDSRPPSKKRDTSHVRLEISTLVLFEWSDLSTVIDVLRDHNFERSTIRMCVRQPGEYS